ncbi:cytochrome c oxidase assembly protein COX16 homolog, mitochondrial isoform 1-T1 [Liasis olivaceus]
MSSTSNVSQSRKSIGRGNCLIQMKGRKRSLYRSVLIVGGSFGLREFAQIRYDIQKVRGKMDPELIKKLKKSNVTLESEYEKIKNASFDDWKNIRGPRPWEETGSNQEKQR